MRAVLKSFDSPDIKGDFYKFYPDDPEKFCFLLELEIGIENEKGADLFGIVVVTPKWLLETYTNPLFPKDKILIGRHYLIVFEYNFEKIINFIKNYIENCAGDSWDEIAEKIGRIGHWEFEDYQEYKEPEK